MTRDTFHPESVAARSSALRVVRECSERLGEERGLLYVLALEYAADDEEDFLARNSIPTMTRRNRAVRNDYTS